jgi:hypothetical protein
VARSTPTGTLAGTVLGIVAAREVGHALSCALRATAVAILDLSCSQSLAGQMRLAIAEPEGQPDPISREGGTLDQPARD